MATEAIRQAAVDRALRMLDAAGAVYAVQFDGNTYGTLPIAPPPPAKPARPRYKRGLTRAHYLPYLADMQPGDSAAIPAGPFDLTVMAANVSGAVVHMWGAGAAITHRNDTAGTIEVLRMF
ncbi:MAG: hypothetical protein ACOYBR_10325 [Fluviibacter sp.]